MEYKKINEKNEINFVKMMSKENVNAEEIREGLIKLACNRMMKVNKEGFENLLEDVKNIDYSTVDGWLAGVPSNFEYLAANVYHLLKLYYGFCDEENPEYQEFAHPDRVSYVVTYVRENRNTPYAIENCKKILIHLGAIKKVKDTIWICRHAQNFCARFEIQDKAFERYLEAGEETAYIEAPSKIRGQLARKIAKMSDEVVIVAASCLLMTVDNRTYKRACDRLNQQNYLNKQIKRGEVSGEAKREKVIELNERYGMTLKEAAIAKDLGDFDITTLQRIHRDSYGGRLYHSWTTVRKSFRETAILRGQLANKGLAEVDLSQCNFYILMCVYMKETGNIPTQLLALAVLSGKLRETIAILSEGVYRDTVCGKRFEINFDEIENYKQAKEFKSLLKLFTLKAANCKCGTKAGQIMDAALAKIDSDFARWLRNNRRGFKIFGTEFSGKQSRVPYITQSNEVEFMFGRIIRHENPTKGKTVKNTEYQFFKTQTGLIGNCINKGVNFLIPIHDALIVKSEDVQKVLEGLNETAKMRGYYAPFAKVTYFNNMKEVTNKTAQEKCEEIFQNPTKATMYYYKDGENEETKKICERTQKCYRSLRKYYKY